MNVNRLEIERFRNLTQVTWEPQERVNIVYGENAQGKTNLLEALWLFTGGRSFRRAKDAELVQFGENQATLSMTFTGEGRAQTASLTIDHRRHATLNELPQKSATALMGHFTAVVFSPDHLSLVKEGPEGRRRFLDAAICQIRPAYVQLLADYSHTLTQRNALLKEAHRAPDMDLLRAFTLRLAETGSRLLQTRLHYVARLTPHVSRMYDGLSTGREQITLAYETPTDTTVDDRIALRTRLLEGWDESLRADVQAGFTTVGPHRDDLCLQIDGTAARTFGSQGQQRSAVLALKLAEAALLEECNGEKPIILLDDVLSELDENRRQYLLERLVEWQVFITCCDPAAVRRITDGKAYRMEQGILTEEQ